MVGVASASLLENLTVHYACRKLFDALSGPGFETLQLHYLKPHRMFVLWGFCVLIEEFKITLDYFE